MKKILIAGSSSGIGRAIAECLIAKGYYVIGLARDHQKFNPDVSNYQTYRVDFANINTLEELFKSIIKAHPNIDTVICSAGYGDFAELEQFSVGRMQSILNVNFLSQAILVKTFLPAMKKQQNGKIILMGSESALEGQKKGSMYCATKFALRGFAQSIRKECATSSVTVTLINPGLVDTPFFDDLDFQPAIGQDHAIKPTQIATLVVTIIDEDTNCVYEEVNLRPMKKMIRKKLLIS